MTNEIGFEVEMSMPFDSAVERVVSALKTEGFGVLTRIDVRATLKEELGEDFRPYVIMGACNPPMAHRALLEESVVGLMLPCNVTVEAISETASLVRIANPEVMMMIGSLQENPVLVEVAQTARAHLERVAEALLEP